MEEEPLYSANSDCTTVFSPKGEQISIQQAKARLRAYKSKQRQGKGNEKTNVYNINHYTSQLKKTKHG